MRYLNQVWKTGKGCRHQIPCSCISVDVSLEVLIPDDAKPSAFPIHGLDQRSDRFGMQQVVGIQEMKIIPFCCQDPRVASGRQTTVWLENISDPTGIPSRDGFGVIIRAVIDDDDLNSRIRLPGAVLSIAAPK